MAAGNASEAPEKVTPSPVTTARSSTSLSETNFSTTALEQMGTNSTSHDSFTAHQPDFTQASLVSVLNSELSNAEEPSSAASICSSDVVVVLNGRVLPRPPLPSEREFLRGRSSTPIRIPYDPVRPRRSRSEPPGRPSRSSNWPQLDMDSSTSNNAINESNFDDLFMQRARLRSTRRPMYDGDSNRNLAGRRLFFGNEENVGIQLIARTRLNRPGLFQARRNQLINNFNRLAQAPNAQEDAAVNNNDNAENDVEAAPPDPARAIPLPPPLPPHMLRPLGTPSATGPTAQFFVFRRPMAPQMTGVRNGTADRGRPRQRRRVTWNEGSAANGESPQPANDGRPSNDNGNGNNTNNTDNTTNATTGTGNNNNDAGQSASNCILS